MSFASGPVRFKEKFENVSKGPENLHGLKSVNVFRDQLDYKMNFVLFGKFVCETRCSISKPPDFCAKIAIFALVQLATMIVSHC